MIPAVVVRVLLIVLIIFNYFVVDSFIISFCSASWRSQLILSRIYDGFLPRISWTNWAKAEICCQIWPGAVVHKTTLRRHRNRFMGTLGKSGICWKMLKNRCCIWLSYFVCTLKGRKLLRPVREVAGALYTLVYIAFHVVRDFFLNNVSV